MKIRVGVMVVFWAMGLYAFAAQTECEKECAGVCDGTAIIDCAGVCNGDASEDCTGACDGTALIDCAGNCDGGAADDCEGVCGGTALEDCAGVCNGDAQEDCAGTCQGDAVEDCAGVCEGSSVEDCTGTCEGMAVEDCTGACEGTAVEDCTGACEGTALEDCTGACEGTAVEDCTGTCEGTAVEDCTGACEGTALEDCTGACEGTALEDCTGACEGTALEDCTGTCEGTALEDCAGTCEGSALEDCAGSCGGAVVEDCLDVCGGSAITDKCGVCVGDGSSCAPIAHDTAADSYVSSSNGNGNYGTATEMVVDRSYQETYLRFDVSDVPPGSTVTSASLTAYAFEGYAWGDNGNVYSYLVADDSWGETTLTWNNKPAVSGDALGSWWLWYNNDPAFQTGSYETTELAAAIQQEANGDGVISLRLNSSGYRTNYYSSESATVGIATDVTSSTSLQGTCSAGTTRSCPAGMVAVGYSGQTGGWFDHIHLICQTLDVNGSLSGSYHYTSQLGTSSGGNEQGNKLCSSNQVMVGGYVRSGDHLDYVQGRCKSATDVAAGSANSSNSNASGMGNSSGGNDRGTQLCPDGQFVTGVAGGNSTYPCSLQWQCSGTRKYAPVLKVWYLDCNGDYEGSAYLDTEGQCVGGNTGN